MRTIKFKIIKPITTDWTEFGAVLRQLNKTIIPIYNKASVDMYQRLLDPETRLKNGSESGQIQQWSTDMIYHPVYEAVKSSYIALGVTGKIRSSFAGAKAKDIRQGMAGVPFVSSKRFPLTFYRQGKFKFALENEDGRENFYIMIPLPQWQAKEEVDKYKPWEKYEFVSGKQQQVKVLLMTKAYRNQQDKDITQALASGDYPASTIEITNRDKSWYVSVVFDPPVIKHSLNSKTTATIEFSFDNPITCSIAGKELRIKNNEVYFLTKNQLARLKAQSTQNRYSRGGRGKNYKFENIEKISEPYRLRRKKLIENWCSLVDRFLINNNVGKVTIIEPDMEDKKKQLLTRLYWPVAEIQQKLEEAIKKTGIKIAH